MSLSFFFPRFFFSCLRSPPSSYWHSIIRDTRGRVSSFLPTSFDASSFISNCVIAINHALTFWSELKATRIVTGDKMVQRNGLTRWDKFRSRDGLLNVSWRTNRLVLDVRLVIAVVSSFFFLLLFLRVTWILDKLDRKLISLADDRVFFI